MFGTKPHRRRFPGQASGPPSSAPTASLTRLPSAVSSLMLSVFTTCSVTRPKQLPTAQTIATTMARPPTDPSSGFQAYVIKKKVGSLGTEAEAEVGGMALKMRVRPLEAVQYSKIARIPTDSESLGHFHREQDVHVNRRSFAQHSLGWFAISGVSSCATQYKVPVETTYKEVVSSVLMSADEKTLVVMTDHFHYIFDIPAPLVQALKGTFHPYVKATFSTFRVDARGKMSGAISLLILSAPNDALETAISAGFTRISNGAVLTIPLHGERFTSVNILPTAQYRLNTTYEIDVVIEGYTYKPTPIASVEGGLALWGLILIGAPIALVSGQK